jgi:hypothetical protein
MAEILTCYPAPMPEVASRLVEGLAVAVTPSDSTLHTFDNEVATEIWGLLDGRHSVAQVVEGIVGSFQVERKQAETDVVQFVQLLAERGLVQLHPAALPAPSR